MASDAIAEREQIQAAQLSYEQRREREEHVRRVTTGRVRLIPGQIWEFHRYMEPSVQEAWKRWEARNPEVKMPPIESVDTYELEEATQFSIWQRLARLRNLKTGGIARIYCDRLEKGESLAPGSHWRLVDG